MPILQIEDAWHCDLLSSISTTSPILLDDFTIYFWFVLQSSLLSDILLVNEKNISINFIQEQVSSFFNLKLSDMTSSRRSINIARPRQIAMYICKAITSFSYPEIGKAFGGKDHTTVMHAVKKIEALLLVDQKLKKQLSEIKISIIST